jgi:hypothetical protein
LRLCSLRFGRSGIVGRSGKTRAWPGRLPREYHYRLDLRMLAGGLIDPHEGLAQGR